MKSTEQKAAESSKYQKFQIRKIHRSELKEAEYNPRTMDDESRKRLKHVIKTIGLVEPPVWNERTGRLVGGHQRLRAMDSLHKDADYFLDVAVIDVDEKKEIETNVALNNASIMGEFDIDLMKELSMQHEDLDFKAIGFTDSDLDLILGGDLTELLEDAPPGSRGKREDQGDKRRAQKCTDKV